MTDFLKGKVVVVTGGGRGIGRAVALACAAEGASVVVDDYGVSVGGAEPTSDVAESVAAEIREAGGTAVATAESVTSLAGGERIVLRAVQEFGRLDGVVCVAGILRERMLFNMTEDEWDSVVETHLKGTFTLFRAASAVMRRQRSGTLIGFTSGVGMLGSVAQANYAAAKGGVVSLVRSAAVGLDKYGVTANAIAPVARTRMSAGVPGTLAENGDAADVAPMVVYLLSDGAREVTGQVYTVVGGRIALWAQPRESRSVVKQGGRWTPQELAEVFPTAVGYERMPIFEVYERMAAGAANSSSGSPADS